MIGIGGAASFVAPLTPGLRGLGCGPRPASGQCGGAAGQAHPPASLLER